MTSTHRTPKPDFLLKSYHCRCRSWISHASAHLVLKLWKSLCPQAAPKCDSFRVGPRGVGTVPSFLTIQPLLLVWQRTGLPMLVILKTITENGYFVQ